MTRRPTAKGWCPGAYNPMMSGDGLIVRVRPFYARLSAAQVFGLCDLAQRHGNGFLDLTNRANIQIRGVLDRDLDTLISALANLDLLDSTPETERRRNIMVFPFWTGDDDTQQVTRALLNALTQLPDLPAKFGFAIDTGYAPVLTGCSADIRVERAKDGFIVRGDGMHLGRDVKKDAVIPAILEMARWFSDRRTGTDRRMSHVLEHAQLPAAWRAAKPLETAPCPVPGPNPSGYVLGAPFGQIDARALARLLLQTGAPALRVTPWRLFVLEDVTTVMPSDFVTAAEDRLLRVDACPGAPFCDSATVETRTLARRLAPIADGSLHISGCAKGCARKGSAATTIVGNNGLFDLVENGHAWDAPKTTGLRPEDIFAEATDPL
ncbi:precorrin-3B synthase [Roseobacter sp. YSTF-M11]|uniref:Precorrin-3B synthase n=1 Tax=Roseobacter insulae TaxID=2859783 RepID=A0A9X1FW04_9RHOB|nr:precorrin-3B synthase [Roseobacter insulae]MBW4709100.1 precorrin-3B synthase [Roseobacter insulae]